MRCLCAVVVVVCWAGGLAGLSGCGAADCGPAPLVFELRGTVQGTDGATCARIERSPESLDDGVLCKACPFVLHRVVVVHEGARFEVTDPALLEYEASHHNWGDTAVAQLDDGREARVRLLYGVDGPLGEPGNWSMSLALDGDEPIELEVEPRNSEAQSRALTEP